MGNIWYSKHLKRPFESYSAWNFGHERAVGAMCTEFTTCLCLLHKTRTTVRTLQMTVWRCLSAIRRSFCVVSWSQTKHGSIARDQRTVEIVDFRWQTCSKESEDCTIGRKGDGHGFLAFLPREGQFLTELQKKCLHLAKKKCSPIMWMHTSALARAKLIKLGYELVSHPPYARFGPV